MAVDEDSVHPMRHAVRRPRLVNVGVGFDGAKLDGAGAQPSPVHTNFPSGVVMGLAMRPDEFAGI